MPCVRFLNRFNILSDFCFGWQEIAFPSRSHCHLLLTQPIGPGSGSGPVCRGPQAGRGATHQAGPGSAEDTSGFPKPRRQWERTKEFQGNSSIFQSQISAPGTPEDVLLLWHPDSCPHIACMVPPHIRYCCSQSSLQFPRALNTAPVRNIALFFNDTETFEHCISRIPSRER